VLLWAFILFSPFFFEEFGIYFSFTVPVSMIFFYMIVRNLFLLWYEYPLKDVFRVDTLYIEKVLPNGVTQRGAWCDLQSVTSINILPSFDLRLLLKEYLFGYAPVKLFFSDGTVISVSKLFWATPSKQNFNKIFFGIAMNGPLGNPFLLEARELLFHLRVINKMVAENAFFRWCFVSQVFPVAMLCAAHILYLAGTSWRMYVFYTALAVLSAPLLLLAVYVYFRNSGQPGFFLKNRNSIYRENLATRPSVATRRVEPSEERTENALQP